MNVEFQLYLEYVFHYQWYNLLHFQCIHIIGLCLIFLLASFDNCFFKLFLLFFQGGKCIDDAVNFAFIEVIQQSVAVFFVCVLSSFQQSIPTNQ